MGILSYRENCSNYADAVPSCEDATGVLQEYLDKIREQDTPLDNVREAQRSLEEVLLSFQESYNLDHQGSCRQLL